MKLSDTESRPAYVDIARQETIWILKRLPPINTKGMLHVKDFNSEFLFCMNLRDFDGVNQNSDTVYITKVKDLV